MAPFVRVPPYEDKAFLTNSGIPRPKGKLFDHEKWFLTYLIYLLECTILSEFPPIHFLRVYAFGEIGLRRYGNVYIFTSHLQILSANCLHQNICYNEKWFEASEINITQHYIQLEDNLHQVGATKFVDCCKPQLLPISKLLGQPKFGSAMYVFQPVAQKSKSLSLSACA